ncbi:DEAD/DEAH box helicase [Longibacter salinarum]|uniref:DEAD/DEAH box helicase n=1 Tax=Longibacter salinarum TaxID=1850348 RepID=A0A2A8CV60_9BACT|nr:DEAD/DEAH box helicase [Longibacter salinarum]PEN12536.1 DEAD/DEAH box helicase [Longibacter salinarum]
MASDTPSSYTRVIDLTSKAQKKKRRAEVGELPQPDPPLDELTIDDLPDDIEQAVRAAGWTSLMPVQQKAIPYMLAGRDIIVQSRTGSGKTGAFLLPLFQMLDPSKKEQQVLILTPTRELARQVFEEFERMKIATPQTNELEAVLIYGGVGYGPQIEALKDGAQFVVGTPGRVLDLLKKKKFDASHIHALILDEADEMLSMGFYPDMMEIRDFLPEDRESYMFSATMPAKVRTVARDFLNDPGFLSLSSERVSVEEMKYRYYLVPPMQKDSTLRRLIELEEPESSIIFCNTKREVSYVAQFLNNSGYQAEEMSGDLSQTAREEAIDRLRGGDTRFLVATDVAARGIDVSELSHVFIYDVPQDREYLIHRSGRTARAGKKGTTIILATNEDEFELLRMARRYDIEVERHELPEDPIQVAEDALETQYRETDAEEEIIEEFVPLVSRLAQSRPELLATLVAELYENVQAEKEAEEEDE